MDSFPARRDKSAGSATKRHLRAEKELNDPQSLYRAVPKLVRVGTDRAVSILMVYLSAHISDKSLYHNFGDYSSDLRRTLDPFPNNCKSGLSCRPDSFHFLLKTG